MRMRWMTVLVFCGLSFFLFSPSNADAQQFRWATCDIEFVGGGDVNIVHLTETSVEPVFVNKWFQFHPTYTNRLLVIALTAQQKGVPVKVRFDNVTSTIYQMRLSPDGTYD